MCAHKSHEPKLFGSSSVGSNNYELQSRHCGPHTEQLIRDEEEAFLNPHCILRVIWKSFDLLNANLPAAQINRPSVKRFNKRVQTVTSVFNELQWHPILLSEDSVLHG